MGFVTTYLSPTEYDLGLMGYTIGYKPLNSVAAYVICKFYHGTVLRFVAVIARRQDIFHRFPGGEPEMGV
jgi:hypothetical protein